MLARLARCSCNLKLKQHAAQGAALKLSHFLLPSAGWFGFPPRVLRLRPEQVLTINCPLSFFTFWVDVGRVVVSERVRKVRLIFVLEGGWLSYYNDYNHQSKRGERLNVLSCFVPAAPHSRFSEGNRDPLFYYFIATIILVGRCLTSSKHFLLFNYTTLAHRVWPDI